MLPATLCARQFDRSLLTTMHLCEPLLTVALVLLTVALVAHRVETAGRRRQRGFGAANDVDAACISESAVAARRENIDGMYSSMEDGDAESIGPDPAEVFGEWWRSEAVTREAAKALTNNRPVHIRNFLRPAVAEALHTELYNASNTSAFQRFTSTSRNYQFRYSAQYAFPRQEQSSDTFETLPLATGLLRALDSLQMKRWVEQAAGCNVSSRVMAGATYFAPGDYVGPHTDTGGGHQQGAKRRVTFVFHLAKDWDTVYGGDLVFATPLSLITASYNTMTIFSVTKAAYHLVTPVWAETPLSRRRLAVSGWWMSHDAIEVDNFVKKFDDAKKARRHITVINGVTGQKVIHSNRSIWVEGSTSE